MLDKVFSAPLREGGDDNAPPRPPRAVQRCTVCGSIIDRPPEEAVAGEQLVCFWCAFVDPQG